MVDGGYYEAGNYYFYINDHLGNNRIVANAAASVVQSTQYYPFGMPFADATGQDIQPYKYNNKELDGRNGLNMYDYSARQMDFALPGFTTVDPLAEKFYSISPYVYCLNNPIRLIDPDGKAPMGGPGWPVNPVDYQRMVASQKVDQTIKANSSTIQKNGALAVASLSDINDAVVLGTTITRGSSGAVNIDGTPAGGIGVGFAALGTVLPVFSGSAVKGFFTKVGKALGIGGDAAKSIEKTTTVYRAVSGAEAADIAENGFRNVPGSYETGKLFAPTVGEAVQFGKNNFKFDGIPNTIMKVEVPNSIINNAYKFNPDGMNAISIPKDQLYLLKGTPLPYSPLK